MRAVTTPLLAVARLANTTFSWLISLVAPQIHEMIAASDRIGPTIGWGALVGLTAALLL